MSTQNIARIYAFRGCVASGSPFDTAVSMDTGTGTSVTGSALTTATANSMMVVLGGTTDAGVTYSAPGGPVDSIVAASGSDGCQFMAYDDAPSGAAGLKAAPTVTGSISRPWTACTFALKPA